MKMHLLPSRNTHFSDFKRKMVEPENVEKHPGQDLIELDYVDLFTDGSWWDTALADYSIGSWAVVCPQLDQWVARGTLAGLRQTNDRAELRAIKAAMEITYDCKGLVVIWSDSAYAASGLNRLLLHPHDLPADLGDGLWLEVQSALQGRAGELRVHHVAAHRTSRQQDDPVDQGTAKWNDRADIGQWDPHNTFDVPNLFIFAMPYTDRTSNYDASASLASQASPGHLRLPAPCRA